MTSRINFYSIAISVVSVPLMLLFLYLWLTKPCPPCFESGQTVTVHDTIWPPKELKPVVVKVPEPWGIKPKYALKKKLPNIPVIGKPDTIKITDCDTTIILPFNPCADVAYYSDTIEAEQVKAVINDTVVNNRIFGRSVWLANLKPEVRTTTTVVKKEKWKFYVGASFTINQRFMNRWGVGPSALVTIPKVGGISYTFDARNFAHTGSFFVLVRLKK